MPVQLYNSEAVGLLATHFPLRMEPNFGWGNILSIFMMQQNLRFLLTFSSIDERGNACDVSGQGRVFTNIATTPFATVNGIIPYAYTDGAARYFQRLSEPGLNISGDLTIMCWYYATNIVALQNLLGKYYSVGNKKQYICQLLATSYPQFMVSGDGINDVTVTGTIKPFVLNDWNFYAARYTPSTDISVWLNPNSPADYDSFAVPALAALHTDTEPLEIFRSNRANMCANNSRFSIVAGYAASLTKTSIWATYQLTRPYYKVR